MSENLVEKLALAFGTLERLDLRVGSMWIHPQYVEPLALSGSLDRVSSKIVQQALVDRGGVYEGLFLGAQVFSSDKVPLKHVGLI